jgi:hypothetical protein
MSIALEKYKKILVDLYVERTIQYRRDHDKHGRYLRRGEWRYIAHEVAKQFKLMAESADRFDSEVIARTLIESDKQHRQQTRKNGMYLTYEDVRQVALNAANRIFETHERS